MKPSSDSARQYSRSNAERFRGELYDFLRIPSVSTDPNHAADMQRAAEWLVDHLRRLGMDRAEVMPTPGHPVAYGEWLGAGPDKPTVLVYGHYDVVPAAIEDGWDTLPFEPVEKDGKIFARGATDDKGQLFIQVKALESYLQTASQAPVNVKFMIEGEEELGSPNLVQFMREHLHLIEADLCVISDTSMRRMEKPVINYSVRGLTYLQVELQGPANDLHSGLWGGTVHNPALALVEILSKLYKEDNTIAVPGFYDDVMPLSEEERAIIAQSDLSEEQCKQSTGVPAVWGDSDYTIRERISARPSLDINGLWSGWSGPGPKTIVPAKAGAKLSARLVDNQDPHKIYQQIKDFIESLVPPTVNSEIQLINSAKPALFSFDIPAMQAASSAYEMGWGAKPTFTRSGGSLPIVAEIANLMDIPVVMMGYGLDDDGLHSPNEHFNIEMFHRGIETAVVFLEELAKLSS